ncbi:MAG TPA: hypothetical protein VKN35_14910, partial [Xanthomonadales bacterium]|nr:hypothetical protein [Xanthomonadales bacterium]
SLAFLFTFCVVCALAFLKQAGSRLITGAGAVSAAAATLALVWRLAHQKPWSLAFLVGLVLIAVFARPWILGKFVESDS